MRLAVLAGIDHAVRFPAFHSDCAAANNVVVRRFDLLEQESVRSAYRRG
jgi:hypothetical protein